MKVFSPSTPSQKELIISLLYIVQENNDHHKNY